MEQYTSHLNWFDISLISIVFISTIFAMFRGLIKAVFSLISWVGSGFLTLYLYPTSHRLLAGEVHNEKLAMALASLGVFLIIFIILAIINSFFVHLLRKQSGGLIDRSLGVCFGAARGILIVCMIFFSISLTSKMLHLGKNPDRPGPQWFATAGTYELLAMSSSAMLAMLPSDLPAQLEQTVSKLKDITLSTMGEELEATSGGTKTLSAADRVLMKQVIATLPQENLAEVYKKYDGNPSSLSEFEKVEIFRDIVTLYNQRVTENQVPADKIIDADKIKALEATLNEGKPGAGATDATTDSDLGYKDHNIKQLNRLIDGVK